MNLFAYALGFLLLCVLGLRAWLEIEQVSAEADQMAHFQNPHDPEP